MRKVVLFMHISLDGLAADANGGLDWISYDEEIEKYADGIVSSVGSPLYGRVTYQLMESYWPTVLDDPSATGHTLAHARWLQDVEKIVFSKTLPQVTWHNSTLIKDNIAQEIARLKQQPGKDLVIFGSPTLTQSLMKLDLIDTYRLTVNPVILGKGASFFSAVKEKTDLKLISSETFASGVLALHYERH
jgi:dihydrofolate reductase